MHVKATKPPKSSSCICNHKCHRQTPEQLLKCQVLARYRRTKDTAMALHVITIAQLNLLIYRKTTEQQLKCPVPGKETEKKYDTFDFKGPSNEDES